MKVEEGFDFSAFSSASQADSLLKEEIAISSNTASVGDAKQTTESDNALASWQPTSELMNVILREDSTVAGFNFRLDNDVYMAANRESVLTVFPVLTSTFSFS